VQKTPLSGGLGVSPEKTLGRVGGIGEARSFIGYGRFGGKIRDEVIVRLVTLGFTEAFRLWSVPTNANRPFARALNALAHSNRFHT